MSADQQIDLELEIPASLVQQVEAFARTQAGLKLERAGPSREWVSSAIVIMSLATNSLILANQLLRLKDILRGKPDSDKVKLRNVVGDELRLVEATEQKLLDLSKSAGL